MKMRVFVASELTTMSAAVTVLYDLHLWCLSVLTAVQGAAAGTGRNRRAFVGGIPRHQGTRANVTSRCFLATCSTAATWAYTCKMNKDVCVFVTGVGASLQPVVWTGPGQEQRGSRRCSQVSDVIAVLYTSRCTCTIMYIVDNTFMQ